MTDNGDCSRGKELTVGEHDAGGRLDAFIAANMPEHVSRARVKDIIKGSGAMVGGAECKEPNYRIKIYCFQSVKRSSRYTFSR